MIAQFACDLYLGSPVILVVSATQVVKDQESKMMAKRL